MNPRDHMSTGTLFCLDLLKAKFGCSSMLHLDCPPILKGSDPYDPEYDRAFQLRKRAQQSIDIFREKNNAST